MARTRLVRPFIIAAFAALGAFLAAPGAASMLWATSHEQPRQKKPTMQAPGTATPRTAAPQPTPVLTTQTPTTLDDYAQYVGNRLQAEAMQVKTSGMADVRLTIGRDGAVRQTEVKRLDGPATLRNQIMSMASQLKLPPLPADSRAQELVVDTTVAFNYPGRDMLDRFGRISERR
jgi:Gram-negative bacterial TonB protein C-terminal